MIWLTIHNIKPQFHPNCPPCSEKSPPKATPNNGVKTPQLAVCWWSPFTFSNTLTFPFPSLLGFCSHRKIANIPFFARDSHNTKQLSVGGDFAHTCVARSSTHFVSLYVCVCAHISLSLCWNVCFINLLIYISKEGKLRSSPPTHHLLPPTSGRSHVEARWKTCGGIRHPSPCFFGMLHDSQGSRARRRMTDDLRRRGRSSLIPLLTQSTRTRTDIS